MNTKRLYFDNVYRTKADAVILRTDELNENTRLLLDQTIFFPTGGGQSCDLGFISIDGITYNVIDVYEEDGNIYHVLDAGSKSVKIKPGDKAVMSIDWNRRFDNMQRHCGEHILSGVIYKLYGGGNNGFHMGDEYITIDIAFDKDSKYRKITQEMADEAEIAANKVIWNDDAIHTDFFTDKRDAEKLPLRKHLAFDEDISIVTIGGYDAPDDCVACCGTHPSSAGQVGLIKIYKVEPNKGMSRIYFEAGMRAFENYRNQFNILKKIEFDLSAGDDDILEKYRIQKYKLASKNDELYKIKKARNKAEAVNIINSRNDVCIKEYDSLTTNDILNIGKIVAAHRDDLTILVDLNSLTVFLFSGGIPNCAAIIADTAIPLGAKGGGKTTSARATFMDRDSIRKFLSLF